MTPRADIEAEEGDDPPPIVGETGRLRVLRDRCDTCIFRPGNLMNLRPGRLREMVASVRRSDTAVICHKTLGDDRGAICRGSFDTVDTTPVQIARRLDAAGLPAIEWVDPPTPKGE